MVDILGNCGKTREIPPRQVDQRRRVSSLPRPRIQVVHETVQQKCARKHFQQTSQLFVPPGN